MATIEEATKAMKFTSPLPTIPRSKITTTNNRFGSASPSASVICEEVFDDTCQPSAEEINDYALFLGIDTIKETHLLYLAKEGLMSALPLEWKICYSEEKCGHYYYNTNTKQSQWDHPLDSVYRKLVEHARQKYGITIATPIIDNSEDVSQLDSGIRSLQCNDDFDNTNNTNEMSSPMNNVNNFNDNDNYGTGLGMNAKQTISNASVGVGFGLVPTTCNTSATNFNSTTSTCGFSGNVSRFLESRSKNFGPIFMPVKNTRFEVAKTNPQISLAMKFGDSFGQKGAQVQTATVVSATATTINKSAANTGTTTFGVEKKGFQLSGTGAMFLKSRRQIDSRLVQTNHGMMSTTPTPTLILPNSNIIAEEAAGTPLGVRGILRDSILTDMRRRFETDVHDLQGIGDASGQINEDKKSVRFNLDETAKMRSSPDEDASSSRKITLSPDLSINTDEDEDDAGADDDLWDEHDDDEKRCIGMGNISVDGNCAVGYQEYQQACSNPIHTNDGKHMREIRLIPVPKSQTIQMVKAQSFSIDLPERDRSKLNELMRSQSVDVAAAGTVSAVSYLEQLKDHNSIVKPLYEDTDSDSKGSSVRSFIINKSEQDPNAFDLDELGRKHSRDVEQLERKLEQPTSSAKENDKSALRTFKAASKLVGFLKQDNVIVDDVLPVVLPLTSTDAAFSKERQKDDMKLRRQKMEKEKQLFVMEERERLEEQLQSGIDAMKQAHEQKLKNLHHEYELRLTSHQHQIEESIELQLENYRAQHQKEFDMKRKLVVDQHKAHMVTLQSNYAEILHELERDLKSEEELMKKEHASKLLQMREKLEHELEIEKQRIRDTAEDRLYEKVRCEKRLLEDKYRCLKEKYVRLKTDVKLSLERRNRRREAQALQHQSLHTNTTTGSETERSLSNKPSIGNSENRSLSYSTSYQERCDVAGASNSVTTTAAKQLGVKPPVPPKTRLTGAARAQEPTTKRDPSIERSSQQSARKPSIGSNYIKHFHIDDDTTSLSQSDTTISNNYTKGHYLPVPNLPPVVLTDNGNSDSEALLQCNQENNNNSARSADQRTRVFFRAKSASTSRLNSDNFKNDRPCTPVENLRHQLQKLEDLEDQFPDNTLDTTYHLRYPFTDISNDHVGTGSGDGTSSELEFFKHRIHLERDSVRRAKESLRTKRTNFRARQREIKHRHKSTITRHTLDQLIQEEKELSEMEVNLHRTRALLGEKVIRLRHLEQSLLRIYEKEKPNVDAVWCVGEQKDDATLSDLSSHSSSGFSSTDFGSGTVDMQNMNKNKDIYHQESNECIQNLEILNVEIREILDILGQKQPGMTFPMISPSELNWSHMLGGVTGVGTGGNATVSHLQQQTKLQPQQQIQKPVLHTPQSITTLADRLETYRQLAAGRMQTSMGGAILAANTIVSQSPRAVNYTTNLVERTRDLRNWLRQAKTEHDLLAGISMQYGVALTTSDSVSILNASISSGSAVAAIPGVSCLGGKNGVGTQTNL